jgi:hypothetical protein
LFHVHVHTSFLMGVPVLVCPSFRTGFHPAFTIMEKFHRLILKINRNNNNDRIGVAGTPP